MNRLLLLLAVGLVTSDKLDRTYLPPPGAKLSGGSLDDLLIPLEYPKETNIEQIPNGQFPRIYTENTFTGHPSHQSLDNRKLKSTVPIDFSTSTYPADFSQATSFPASRDDSTVATLRSNLGLYDSFPPKSGTQTQKSYNFPTSSPGFETATNSFIEPSGGANGESPGYYYYGPGLQTYENDIINKENIDIGFSYDPNSGYQYPHQVNDGYLSGNGPAFIPRTATTNEIVQNYQPTAFGYYGGNPMIMTIKTSSPQDFGNMALASKFEDYKSNMPTSSVKQDKQNSDEKQSVRLFQTPLVRYNVPSENKSTSTKGSTSLSNNVGLQQLPTTINNSLIKESAPIRFNQRSGIPMRSRIITKRPQSESDQNAVILNYENLITPEGFSYSFDTSNGIHADESGTANNGVKAKGSYSYTGDDGKIYSVSYTADENGFQPRGDHLPTPPPIPEAIKKVIEQAARDKAAGIIDDGSYDERKYGHTKYQGPMDHYRPSIKSDVLHVDQKTDGKVSRLNGGQRRPMLNDRRFNSKGVNSTPIYNDDIPIMNQKTFSQLINIRPSYIVTDQEGARNMSNLERNIESSNEIPTKVQQITSRLRPVSDAKDNPQSFFDQKTINNIFPQESTVILTENKGPNTSVNDYIPITNKERPTSEKVYQNLNSNKSYKPENISEGILYNIQNKPNQINKLGINKQSGAETITGEGYYYVPPIIKFNPYTEQSGYNKNLFNKYNKFAQQDMEAVVNKRTGLESGQSQQAIDDKITSTQIIINNNTGLIDDLSKNPYIGGPNDQYKVPFYGDMQREVPIQNVDNKDTTYINGMDSGFYESITTPMSSKIEQFENQPTDRYPNQYYQTTINPAVFDQSLRNNVENRVYLPPGLPGISVSQDFVTTTYKPALFGDGINLEVNQNVKIYGLGSSEPTIATRRYPDNVSIFNDGLFTTISPNSGSRFTATYPDSLIGQPVQESINQDNTYGNEFYATRNTLPNIGSDSTSAYVNPDFGLETQYTTGISQVPTYLQTSRISGQEMTTPTLNAESQSVTQRIIGEDFSGPKQPQRFDPITGYNYK